jgi:hypothetical protein
MIGGAPVVAGSSGAWRPIAAEAAETGYVVVWKNGEADQFGVWNTDAKGNYLWTAMGAVAGSNHAIESRETLFQQDLSGDGKIGAASIGPELALLY